MPGAESGDWRRCTDWVSRLNTDWVAAIEIDMGWGNAPHGEGMACQGWRMLNPWAAQNTQAANEKRHQLTTHRSSHDIYPMTNFIQFISISFWRGCCGLYDTSNVGLGNAPSVGEGCKCVGTCAHDGSAIMSVGLHMHLHCIYHMRVFDDTGDTFHVFV